VKDPHLDNDLGGSLCKRLAKVFFSLFWRLSMPSFADRFVADAAVEPAGYRQLTPTTVQGVSIGEGRVALIQVLNQNVRYLDTGIDPTPSTGVRIHAGESIWYNGDLTAIRFIEETSGAEVNILAYK
jgi:hypothetical protein